MGQYAFTRRTVKMRTIDLRHGRASVLASRQTRLRLRWGGEKEGKERMGGSATETANTLTGALPNPGLYT